MKGTFLNDQIEYQIQLNGEQWLQGQSISGSLKLTNHSNSDLNLDDIGHYLCLGVPKKIKLKDPTAFSILEKNIFEENTLVAKESKSLAIDYQLPENAHITETIKSLYISCGKKDSFYETGYLPLKILPLQTISSFLDIFSNFYKFKIKSIKSKKDFVEATMNVPASKEFTGVEKLKILSRIHEKNLELNYVFNVKKIDFTASTNTLKSDVKKIPVIMTPKQYQLYGDSLNQEEILKSIDTVLEQVKVKSFF